MSERLNLFQKLAKIRAMSDFVSKGKRGYNYTYADITEILAKITSGMEKYGVSLIPTIVPGTARVTQNVINTTKFTKTGDSYVNTTTEMLACAEMVFRWVNDENPEECIEVPWFVTGSQGDPSQAFGSGLTYCTRYFLCNYFQIAQSDTDVDAYRSKKKEAAESEDKMIAEGIIDQFEAELKEFLAANPDQKDKVQKLCEKYAKGAKYRAIKEPALASKLLEEFHATFMSK